ncbi:MAG TPA: MBL fold metallo-hydrolase [Candidatus Acidoferrales bacterium]|nr:MBL fold metallo-hydrolase [Candidatus Acidoferrales bacterium]
MNITYIGGPTALIEWGGLRILTDPSLDPAGAVYQFGGYALKKTCASALRPEQLGRVDLVLLSHDHHKDNLDDTGRAFLPIAGRVITTPAAAERLGANATGLAEWQTVEVPAPGMRVLRITATPARHGPAGQDRGPVTGFILTPSNDEKAAVYISGDTVWYEGVAEVARRFPAIRTVILFMGAAQVDAVGPFHLTMTAEEAVEAARAFSAATIVPLHYEGWAHFRESRLFINGVFRNAGIENRLHWMELGKTITVE